MYMQGYRKVFVDGLYKVESGGNYYYTVLLKEYGDDKVLPVFIGAPEAMAIQMALSNVRFKRPLTHDLIISILDSLDISVSKVTIDTVIEGIYTATIVLRDENTGRDRWHIDARPSDSIVIALKTNSPIYVSNKLEKHMVSKEKFLGEDIE